MNAIYECFADRAILKILQNFIIIALIQDISHEISYLLSEVIFHKPE